MSESVMSNGYTLIMEHKDDNNHKKLGSLNLAYLNWEF